MVAHERHEMLVLAAPVVVHVSGPQVARDSLDRFGEIAHQVRVAVVETYADIEPLELVLDQI